MLHNAHAVDAIRHPLYNTVGLQSSAVCTPVELITFKEHLGQCRHANHSTFGGIIPHFCCFSAIPLGICEIPLFYLFNVVVTFSRINSIRTLLHMTNVGCSQVTPTTKQRNVHVLIQKVCIKD